MTTNLIYYLLFLHFVGDFVAQTHWQASNKWNNGIALWSHVSTYAIVICGGLTLVAPSFSALMAFTGITFIAHLMTDYITSKYTHALWDRKDWHNFFVVIGFDQLVHAVCLIAAAEVFLR